MAACAEKNALWEKFLEASGRNLSDALPSPDFAMESEGYGYETAMGRACWPSRDPIGERGGVNLYAMVGNDTVDRWDYLGLVDQKWVSPDVGKTWDLGKCGTIKFTFFTAYISDTKNITTNANGTVGLGAQFFFKMQHSDATNETTTCCCPAGSSIGWIQYVTSDNDPGRQKDAPHFDTLQMGHNFSDDPSIPLGNLQHMNGASVKVEFKITFGCIQGSKMIKSLYENTWSIFARYP